MIKYYIHTQYCFLSHTVQNILDIFIPSSSEGKESACNAGSQVGRSLEEGMATTQYLPGEIPWTRGSTADTIQQGLART